MNKISFVLKKSTKNTKKLCDDLEIVRQYVKDNKDNKEKSGNIPELDINASYEKNFKFYTKYISHLNEKIKKNIKSTADINQALLQTVIQWILANRESCTSSQSNLSTNTLDYFAKVIGPPVQPVQNYKIISNSFQNKETLKGRDSVKARDSVKGRDSVKARDIVKGRDSLQGRQGRDTVKGRVPLKGGRKIVKKPVKKLVKKPVKKLVKK